MNDRSGMVIVWAAGAILVGFLIAAVLLAAPRSASDGSPRLALTGAPRTPTSPVLAADLVPESQGDGAPLSIARGWATWYDDGPGFYAAVPSYRWGDDRYWVQVCLASSPGTCTHALVGDYCACGERRGRPTVIDLSPDAFGELAPLGRGVISVTVERVDGSPVGPTLPPTDGAP